MTLVEAIVSLIDSKIKINDLKKIKYDKKNLEQYNGIDVLTVLETRYVLEQEMTEMLKENLKIK